MSSKRRRNRATSQQTTQPPQDQQQPANRAYTLQDLMEDYQQPSLKDAPTGLALHAAHSPEPDEIELDEEALSLLTDAQWDPFEYEEERWPSPGDMVLTPDPSPELTMAYVHALLAQADAIIESAQDHVHDRYSTTLLAHLGCLQTNWEDMDETLKNLGNTPGRAQPSAQVQTALQWFSRMETDVERLQEHHFRTLAELEDPGQVQPDDHLLKDTVRAVRIKSNAAAMDHCATRRSQASSKEERHAWSHMVFELAHNAEYHWHGTDQDADQENQVSDAMAHCRRLHQEERESFNADLPVRLGEAFEGLSPEMLEKARAVPVETLEFETGVITDSERRTVPGHPHPIDLHCSHVAFFHQGNKHVKGVGDPYPKDYPAELAHRHATEVLTSLDHPDPALLQGVQNTARHLQTLAENSLHCLTQTGLREFMEAARSAGLPNGGIQAMLNVATTYDRSLTNQLMLTGGIAKPTASTQQVKQVLQAARRAGLDDYKLREIAEALDHDDTAALNIPTRTVSPKKVRSIANAARRAGFSQEAIKSIENFLDGEDE